jgi:hypothetical protein
VGNAQNKYFFGRVRDHRVEAEIGDTRPGDLPSSFNAMYSILYKT